MNREKNFYKNLEQRLKESCSFPVNYPYKFIVPIAGLEAVKAVFCHGESLVIKASKKGNYQSVSVTKKAKNTSEIVIQYQALAHIPGIIML